MPYSEEAYQPLVALISEVPDLSILVNNVGQMSHGPFYQMDHQAIWSQIHTNINAQVYTTRAALPNMIE